MPRIRTCSLEGKNGYGWVVLSIGKSRDTHPGVAHPMRWRAALRTGARSQLPAHCSAQSGFWPARC